VGSTEGLAACLRELYAAPELRARMGAAARQHVCGYSTAASVEGIKKALGAA
jgi:hypothetical protein